MQLTNVLECHSSSAVHGRAARRWEARVPTANTPQAVWPDWSRTQNPHGFFNAELFLTHSLSFTASPSCKLSVPCVYLLLRQAVKRFQTEFLCRHHIYWLICWLYYMSDFPLLFTFTSPQLQHETIVLLGLQTALQMLYSFLFQGHPFVIHHIFHSVNNLG